jgi:glycine cleavage system H protein
MAMKLGAFDYIPKPFTPEELSGVTHRAVERKRLFAEMPDTEMIREEIEFVRPGDRYYMADKAWAKLEEDGTVRVGVDWVFRRILGDIVNVDLPYEGDRVEQGKTCALMTTPSIVGSISRLWSPVSGRVVEVNEEVNRNAELIADDPYNSGWLFRVAPANLEDELANLLYVDKNHVFRKRSKNASTIQTVLIADDEVPRERR